MELEGWLEGLNDPLLRQRSAIYIYLRKEISSEEHEMLQCKARNGIPYKLLGAVLYLSRLQDRHDLVDVRFDHSTELPCLDNKLIWTLSDYCCWNPQANGNEYYKRTGEFRLRKYKGLPCARPALIVPELELLRRADGVLFALKADDTFEDIYDELYNLVLIRQSFQLEEYEAAISEFGTFSPNYQFDIALAHIIDCSKETEPAAKWICDHKGDWLEYLSKCARKDSFKIRRRLGIKRLLEELPFEHVI